MLEKIKTQLRRVRYFAKRDILTFNNIVIFAAILVCLSWTWGAIGSMSRNWELEETNKARILAKEKLKLEVEMMKLEQEYYTTDEYKELIAREKGGKMMPGETMVILPKNSQEAINKYVETKEEIPVFRSNFSQWLDFLFR